MAYDFSDFKKRTEEIVDWLTKEFSGIRTGRATPALLDGVLVESYGARVPIQQVGSINVEDPRTLRIASWDKGAVKEIERAITDANLGVSVATDESGVRVIFPELTSERREQLIKIAKQRLEDARVSLRQARDEAIKQIETAEKSGELDQDGKFRAKEDLQKIVDECNAALNELLSKKEAEIAQ